MEFVTGIMQIMPQFKVQQATDIFTSIDLNGDKVLSINEFSLFLKGAQLKRQERI